MKEIVFKGNDLFDLLELLCPVETEDAAQVLNSINGFLVIKDK